LDAQRTWSTSGTFDLRTTWEREVRLLWHPPEHYSRTKGLGTGRKKKEDLSGSKKNLGQRVPYVQRFSRRPISRKGTPGSERGRENVEVKNENKNHEEEERETNKESTSSSLKE